MTDLITETYAWRNPALRQLDESETEAIEALLLGHKVDKVADDHLLLDNGTLIRVVPNDGGCSCSAGDYDLTALGRVDNVITKVEFDYHPGGDGEEVPKECDGLKPPDEWTGHYRIFVLAQDEKILLANIEGSDGNGYYGTGYSLLVREVSA